MNSLPTIGYLCEYFDSTGFLGSLAVDTADQAIGAEHATTIRLDADLEIKRSFSKTRTLKAGTIVRRICYPLQGRAAMTAAEHNAFPKGRW
jgi:hypothetical protein